MRLSTLLNDIFPLPADADRDVLRLILDSRKIQTNDLFLAIKGREVDGRKYIKDAIKQGASAVLLDDETQHLTWENNIPLISMANLQQQLGDIAARFYQYPANKLHMIGVTGTNGKTSCTHFIAQILQLLGEPCGIIGTLGSGFYGALGEAGLTTPDAITLQSMLNEFKEKGAKAVAMEVSSHSIDQGRVNGIPFEIGVFTNLTQDHLDYHGDMQTYANVKKRFLNEFPTQKIVINADDAYGEKWIKELAPQKTIYAYTTTPPKTKVERVSYIYTDEVELTGQGIKAHVNTPWGAGKLSVPLIGQFNLSNILAVLTTLCIYGIPFQEVLKQLAQVKPVPGRMQTLGGYKKPLVVVDYAHTPDALEKVLQALRAHTEGKLLCVFGCGGDRDQGKRPLMAKIAEHWADLVIVTNDNPRHENPEDIAAQIMRGFTHPDRVKIALDRSKAIENSIQWAEANDCILIAGKGAERYQQIGDTKFRFDDVEQVNHYLDVMK